MSARVVIKLTAPMAEPRACAWCRSSLEVTAPAFKVFCSQGCRQFAFRLRRRRATDQRNDESMRFAYADPPYPGLAKRYYGGEDSYGGEVDHAELIASLGAGSYDGWALSTSSKALRNVLPLCPSEARVCPWVKPIGAAPATFGPHNTWEPLIVVGGRKLRPGFRDWLSAHPARGGGSLPGRKPISFCVFLFQQLGMLPGDELVDLFPGTGVVSRAWAEIGRHRPSARSQSDASRPGAGDASLLQHSDASQEYLGDVSPRAARNTGGAHV